MIQLFWCPQTRSSRILWLLEELQQPFERVHIDIRNPEGRQHPEFTRASPMGKVPALRDGEVRLAESAAIAIYLADRYPQAGLAPAIDSSDRGDYLYWMLFTPAVIEPAMAERFNGWEVDPRSIGWGSFDIMMKTLASRLEGRSWLLGERFSAADVLVGSSAYFMKLFGILVDQPSIEAYVERCLSRPAYQRALACEQASAG